MPFRNKHLVELIRQGISSGYRNANYCTPRLPKPLAFFLGNAVKKKGEDGILSQVGQLSEQSVKNMKCARRDLEVE
jgi:hypothetical protein